MDNECHSCGNSFVVDANGVTNHITEDGEIDYDTDGNHVAYKIETTINVGFGE
tara:strand:+ start:145 stop:303 length:159 start_codon:yes stop_codon:yes gene_type:complete